MHLGRTLHTNASRDCFRDCNTIAAVVTITDSIEMENIARHYTLSMIDDVYLLAVGRSFVAQITSCSLLFGAARVEVVADDDRNTNAKLIS
jgi:hypothetical protein